MALQTVNDSTPPLQAPRHCTLRMCTRLHRFPISTLKLTLLLRCIVCFLSFVFPTFFPTFFPICWCFGWTGNTGKKPDRPVKKKDGSTSGYNTNTPTPSPPSPSPPAPPVPPPAPSEAECSNEYSTDLWGQLAVDAVTKHTNESQPLYIHLCFEAVHTYVWCNTVNNNG